MFSLPFRHHIALPIPQGPDWTFVGADVSGEGSDLIALHTRGTASGFVEATVLSAKSRFQEMPFPPAVTPLPTGGTYKFLTVPTKFGHLHSSASRNLVPDLVAVDRRGLGTASTEVHLVAGDTNYTRMRLSTGTALHMTDDTFDFVAGRVHHLAPFHLVAIKKAHTGTGFTEVHALDGSQKFQTFTTQRGTPLPQCGDEMRFVMLSDYDHWWPRVHLLSRLGCVQIYDTQSNRTELNVLRSSDHFTNWCWRVPTDMHMITSGLCDVTTMLHPSRIRKARQPREADLCFIKKSDTGSGRAELHSVRSGRSLNACGSMGPTDREPSHIAVEHIH